MIEFEYRPARGQTAVLFFLVLAGSVMFTYLSLTLDQPINVQGLRLAPQQGRMFFGVLACLSPMGVALMAAMLVASFTSKRRVALSATSIRLPKPTRLGLSTEEIEIPFDAIYHVEIRPFMGSTSLLRLEHQQGVVNVPSNMFPHKKDFAELSEYVMKAVEMAKIVQQCRPSQVDAKRRTE